MTGLGFVSKLLPGGLPAPAAGHAAAMQEIDRLFAADGSVDL